MASTASPISFVALSGNYYECKPLFLQNGQYLLCASGPVVRIMSTATGEHIKSCTNHVGNVTSIKLLRENGDESIVLTSTQLGELSIWSTKSLETLKSFKLDVPIYDAQIPKSFVDKLSFDKDQIINQKIEIYLVVGKSSQSDSTEDNRCKLVLFDGRKEKIRKKIWRMKLHRQCLTSMILPANGIEIIASFSGSNVLLWNTASKTGVIIDSGFGNISSIESNSQGTFVTGHLKGEISLWHQMDTMINAIFTDKSLWTSNSENNLVTLSSDYRLKPVCTKLHWHAHRVETLSLNADSTYLFSGGEEGVLVAWHLATQTKSFLPRLGYGIAFIEARGADSKVAIATSDNAVRVISTGSMKEDWCVQAVSLSSGSKAGDIWGMYKPSVNPFVCDVIADPVSNYLYSNGAPGKIQVFDPENLSLKQSVQVVDFVRVSKKEDDSIMYLPNVSKFAIYRSRAAEKPSFMATVDIYRGEELEATNCLKFWYYNALSKDYSLITQVDFPHGTHSITDLTFTNASHNNSEVMCATASDDGTVKIWRVTKSENANEAKYRWHCAFSFKHRENAVQCLRFSRDNTLLAIASENVVSLWDPILVALKCSVSNPTTNTISSIDFIEPKGDFEGSGTVYLMITTKRTVSVFDLLTMRMLWSIQGRFTATAVCEPESSVGNLPSSFIAVAVEHLASKASKTAEKAVEKSENKESKKSKKSKNVETASKEVTEEKPQERHMLVLLDTHQPRVIHEQSLPCKVTSLCFRHSNNKAASFPAGVFALVESGEFYYCGVMSSSSTTDRASISKRFTKMLPSLHSAEEFTVDGQIEQKTSSASLSSKPWSLELDENSNNIPSVSILYGDLMNKVSSLSNSKSLESVSMPWKQSESSILSAVNDEDTTDRDNSNNEDSMTSEDQNNTFSDEKVAQFESSLVAFFKSSLFSSQNSTVEQEPSQPSKYEKATTPKKAKETNTAPPVVAAVEPQATPVKRGGSKLVSSAIKAPLTGKKSSAASTAELLMSASKPPAEEGTRRSTRKRSNSALTEESYDSDSSVSSVSSNTRSKKRSAAAN